MTIEADRYNHVYLTAGHDALGRRTLLVVGLTAITMVAEVAAGLWTGSMALLADGLHMATHAGALGLAALAYRIARARAHDASFSWGTGKVGDLAGFASALILGVTALAIVWESVSRLAAPSPVAFAEATVVAVLGLLVNGASLLLLGGGPGHHHAPGHAHGHDDHDHGHGHDHHAPGHLHAEPHGDTNHRAALAHVATDALTSILALVALAAGWIWGARWLDPLVGVLGGVLILLWARSLLTEAASVLLDRSEPALAARTRVLAEAAGGEVRDLHAWRVGPGCHAVILSVDGPVDAEALRREVRALPGASHVTVEARGA